VDYTLANVDKSTPEPRIKVTRCGYTEKCMRKFTHQLEL